MNPPHEARALTPEELIEAAARGDLSGDDVERELARVFPAGLPPATQKAYLAWKAGPHAALVEADARRTAEELATLSRQATRGMLTGGEIRSQMRSIIARTERQMLEAEDKAGL